MTDSRHDKPITHGVFTGRSDSFSFDEALRNAVTHAQGTGADLLVPFVLQRIFGQHGGIAGEQCLCVEIRLDEEAGQEVPGGRSANPPAQSLAVVPPGVEAIELGVISSRPPQFVLRGQRLMPTPGWTFHIDSVKTETAAGRIVVQLTDMPPEGMVIQTLGPTPLAVQLGALRTGRYVVELHTRRSPHERHQLLQAIVIEAA